MSTVTLQDILGGPTSAGLSRGPRPDSQRYFRTSFYQVDKTVDRDTEQYTRVYGHTVPWLAMAAYGSPSQQQHP